MHIPKNAFVLVIFVLSLTSCTSKRLYHTIHESCTVGKKSGDDMGSTEHNCSEYSIQYHHANKMAFPLGRFVTTFWERHGDILNTYCHGQLELSTDEWTADRKTPGFVEELITHELVANGNKNDFLKKVGDKSVNVSADKCLENAVLYRYTDRVVEYNPILNIRTDSPIIDGHNKIFEPELIKAITRFFKCVELPELCNCDQD